MEYIITFKNTNLAIKAEQCLLEQKLQVGVLPLPSQISAGCGICVRIAQDEIKSALAPLSDKNIDEIGLYFRVSENGRYSYSEVSDWRSML
ncbi:MAG: DUF3343 domain-containing protein [Oscillospiraceae bacterium]|nr:DUF3343 domain-containing protein [Oscillospiraceae bacterium]